MLSRLLIKLNIDSADLRLPSSTRCTLSKWKSSESREPFERVHSLSGKINVKHDWEHLIFKILLTSLIYTLVTNQLKSRGRIPQTKILMESYLDLKVFATSMIPSVISSGGFWFKLFVPHKTTTFLMLLTTGRLWERHRTCWTLSPPFPQFKAVRSCKNLTQTLW